MQKEIVRKSLFGSQHSIIEIEIPMDAKTVLEILMRNGIFT